MEEGQDVVTIGCNVGQRLGVLFGDILALVISLLFFTSGFFFFFLRQIFLLLLLPLIGATLSKNLEEVRRCHFTIPDG